MLSPASPAQTVAGIKLRTIFLDRDGVLNRKPPEGEYVTGWSRFHLLAGVPEAIARLNRAGLRVIVVSNQRGIALGLYTADDVNAIHAELQRTLAASGAHIDAFYFCPHDKAECDCRKPAPGLYHQALAQFPDIAPESSLMIGDSWSDIEFGHCLGMATIFLEGDPARQKSGADNARVLADQSFTSLAEAVDAILRDDPANKT
ncbi:MAG TPA: HAD family hydrolase [Acidobacteriaceae bacterium]|nr:HAD family hydrolase [Acidobacteriaceae bacterium]